VRVFRIGEGSAAPAKAMRTDQGPTVKPSIAVLPFDNMSGDREQEFFADGMSADIIMGLSRLNSLLVIARNSTFTFKGQAVDVRDVAESLGARYVLEGSIRRGGERVRVTCQLIDAETGNHIWAERFDRELEDTFAVQDEVTTAIVTAIAPEIDQSELERARRKQPEELDTWDLYQRGLARFYEVQSDRGVEIFAQVTKIDPSFAPAWAMGALARTRRALSAQLDHRDAVLREAFDMAQQAMRLSPNDPLSLFANGNVLIYLGQHELGIAKLNEAVSLNPNSAAIHYELAKAYDSVGLQERTIPAIDTAIRLSPRDVAIASFHSIRAFAHFHLGLFEQAAGAALDAMHSPNATVWPFVCYAMTLFRQGEVNAAHRALQQVYKREPNFSLSFVRETLGHFKNNVSGNAVNTLIELGVVERSVG
jgi:adenylate cyclase